MVDAPILTHNPTKSKVIRLGLCVNLRTCRYINRLTVFSWYELGKQWRTTAIYSPNKHRLIYIYNQSMSYARTFIFIFINARFCRTHLERIITQLVVLTKLAVFTF